MTEAFWFVIGAAAGWFAQEYRLYLKVKAGELVKKAKEEVSNLFEEDKK